MSSIRSDFVRLVGVRKVYMIAKTEFLAVQDVTLNVQEGELVSIVGPSGCGKSTVLSILAGLHEATEGTVEIGNAETPFTPGRDVGMVFQKALLLKWRTILDNVLLPAEILGLPHRETRERARYLLQMVGIDKFADAYPQQLSGGMQQRAAIARALVHDPKLILMDEPFGALDAMTRDEMNVELLRIWSAAASKKTILFVTHSIPEAIFLADRILVMTARPGRVAELVPSVLDRPRTISMRGTEAFGHQAVRIFERLHSSRSDADEV